MKTIAMKYVTLILATAFLFACSTDQDCLNESFGEDTWRLDSNETSTTPHSWTFDPTSDTLIITSEISETILRRNYSFDGCSNLIVRNGMVSVLHEIISVDANNITLKLTTDTVHTLYFTKL